MDADAQDRAFGHDAYLLKSIVRDWNDEKAAMIPPTDSRLQLIEAVPS